MPILILQKLYQDNLKKVNLYNVYYANYGIKKTLAAELVEAGDAYLLGC